MRKSLFLFASLLIFVSLGTALTIESPVDIYTRTNVTPLGVGDATGDVVYSLNGNPNTSCRCVENFTTITSPEGLNNITFYDDTSSASKTFLVDTQPPVIESKTPSGIIYERNPHLRIIYSDTSNIQTSKISLTLEGEPLNFTATQNSLDANITNLTEGTYTVSYNIPDEYWREDSLHNATGSWNFTLPVNPVLSGQSPTGVVGDSPEVEITAKDPAGIDREESYIELSGPEDSRLEWGELENLSGEVENGVTFRHAFDGLEDGTYTVTAHVNDTNGNTAEEEWEFTVDTTPPELSFHSHVTGDVVKDSERFEFNVTDLTGVGRVNLSLGNATAEAESSGGLYTASVDTTLIEDGGRELRVTAEDSAGNRATESISLTVDNDAPVIEDVELYPDPAQGGLEISAVARDRSTKIIGARYRIKRTGSDETLDSGRLEAVVGEYDSLEEEVRAVVDLEPLELGSGNYTALLMAEDSAGHRYGWFGREFDVDNSMEAELEIEERLFRQEVGTTSTFSVRVTNTGEVDELVSPSVETPLDASISPEHKRVQAGENKQFELEVRLPGNGSSLGNHSITIRAEGLSSSDSLTTELIGQPLSEERQKIEARFQTLKEDFQDLNESRQDWSLDEEMEQQFQATAELVSEVERLLEEGRYSRAEQRLEEAEENFEETQSAFTGEVTRARLGNLASTAIKLLAVLAVAGLVYGGYRLIPPEEGYDPEKGYTHRPGGKHPLLLELEGRWKRFMEKREEESGESRSEKSVGRWEGYGG